MKMLILLGWLYLIQGIPYGIQDKFIPLHLRLQNMTFSKVSLMKILLLPWLCKGIWAPFIQVYLGPRAWLSFAISGLSIVCFVGSLVPPGNVYGIATTLFLLNTLSAIQDIVVDGLALNCLSEDQLGYGNSLQVVLYKVGSLVGGAGLIYLSNFTSWSTSYICLSILYFISLIIAVKVSKPVCGSERNDYLITGTSIQQNLCCEGNEEIHHNESNKLDHGYIEKHNWKHIRSVLKGAHNILNEVFESKDMAWISCYIVVYKMGERGAINNFPLFLLDQGISANDLAFWNGIVCQGLSILGSALGGVMLAITEKQITLKLLRKYTIHRFISIFICYCVVESWSSHSSHIYDKTILYPLGLIALMYLNFTSGVISTATFTLMMQASRKVSKNSQSTHYSCLASIEVAGKLLFATLAGFIIDTLGISWSFLLFDILALIPYCIL